MDINYDSTKNIKKILSSRSVRLTKKWGQNFLINRGAREKLVNLLNPDLSDLVWEIGPGLGSLTTLLLDRCRSVVVFEIDRGLVDILKDHFSNRDNLTIIQGDVINVWKDVIKHSEIPLKIIGNLPYSSASAIVSSFIENELVVGKMIVTIQKELALRMMARPGSNNYSSFSILCQLAYRIEHRGDLKPGSFFPAPEVMSTIVELLPSGRKQFPDNRSLFFTLVRAVFKSRRKILRNSFLNSDELSSYGIKIILKALEEEGINPGIRGERLPVDVFIRLSNTLNRLIRCI